MPAPKRAVTVGTRASALARWQTDWVIARLQKAWPDLEFALEIFTTTGDRSTDRPLQLSAEKGSLPTTWPTPCSTTKSTWLSTRSKTCPWTRPLA